VITDVAARRSRDPLADELALIERHLGGDETAFAEIYRAHAAAVFRRLARILGPIPERDDLLQDVFVALHRTLPTFRGESRLATLVHRIAINTAYEYLRRSRRRPTSSLDADVLDELTAPAASPEAQAQSREHLARVFACVARIKPKKRIALLLRVVEGLSFEEIAGLVDATPETVAKRVQHGQRELDALMQRADRDERRLA
jgi:RNA polymerase sigma-70 factor, ECF subfamily